MTAPQGATATIGLDAGRGPLVRASLRAAAAAQRKLRVYAVEKNPNADVTLRNLKISQGWGDAVTIVHQDMREWVAPEKADILVSEQVAATRASDARLTLPS